MCVFFFSKVLARFSDVFSFITGLHVAEVNILCAAFKNDGDVLG